MWCGLCFSADYYFVVKVLCSPLSESVWNGYVMNINSYTSHDDNHILTTLPILEYVSLPSRLWILREKKIIYRNLPRDRNVFFPSMFERVPGCCLEIGSHCKSHRDCCLPFDMRDWFFLEDHQTLTRDWAGHKETVQEKREEETTCRLCQWSERGSQGAREGRGGGYAPSPLLLHRVAGEVSFSNHTLPTPAWATASHPTLCQSAACCGSRVREEAATVLLPSWSFPCTWLTGARGRGEVMPSALSVWVGQTTFAGHSHAELLPNTPWAVLKLLPYLQESKRRSTQAWSSRVGSEREGEVQKLLLPPPLCKSSLMCTPALKNLKAFSLWYNITALSNLKLRFNHSFLLPRWKLVPCLLPPKPWLSSAVPKHQQRPMCFYCKPSPLRG